MKPSDTSAAGKVPGQVPSQVQGEGDYVAARKYQQDQHAFARNTGEVDRKAHEAEAALDGPEGEELERAREEAAKGHPRQS